MTTAPKQLCPDCQLPAHEIRLTFGPGFTNISEITYSLPESRPSFWTSSVPVEGSLAAYLCDQCGRVMLYGIPKDV
jgi:hypothetical protein